MAHLALAANLVGAATRLLRDTAGYAATRVQFRRPLGDFQGVAFPLAEVDASLAAARALVRRAATLLAAGAQAEFAATALRSAVRAASKAVHACFQAYGAMAFTEECDAARYGRRIAQLAAQARALLEADEGGEHV
jgi:alkylation response protein AidB-like acyl-CoA dehydrogenase